MYYHIIGVFQNSSILKQFDFIFHTAFKILTFTFILFIALFSHYSYASSIVSVSPSSLSFGEVKVGESKTLHLDLSVGPSDSASVSPSLSNSAYTIVFNDCTTLSASSSTCAISIKFQPTSETSYASEFIIDYPSISQYSNISLSGNGTSSDSNSSPTSPTSSSTTFSPFTQGNENLETTGETIDTVCNSGSAGSDLQRDCNALVNAANANASGTSDALNQITPETATKASQVTQQGATTQERNILSRMTALRSGVLGFSTENFNFNIDGKPLPAGQIAQSYITRNGAGASADDPFFDSKWGFFISGDIAKGDRKGSQLESKAKVKTQGITTGIDYRFSNNLFLGGALGYLNSDSDFNGNSANLDTKGYSLSFYGSYYQENNFFTDFSITYGKNKFDQERLMNFSLNGTTTNQKFTADYKGNYHTILLGAGKDYQKDAWTFGPRVSLEYTRTHSGKINEKASNPNASGSGWATNIESNSLESLVLQLGGRASFAHSTNWGVLIPYAQVDLLHEFKQDSQLISASFTQDPTANQLQIKTDNPDRNYMKIDLGTSAQFKKGTSGFINYSTVLSNSNWDNDAISMGLRIEF